MAAAGGRARIGLIREILPVVDNLERALGVAPEGDGDAFVEGVRLVLPRPAGRPRASGRRDDRAEGRARSTRTSTRRSRPVRRRVRSPAPCSTSSRRATARPTPWSGPPEWWWRPSDAGRQGSIQDARRRQEGLRRRDQEGVPQARPPVPPGPQPGRRVGRGALQGGAGGVLDPVRRRRSASATTRAAGSSAASTRARSGAAAARGCGGGFAGGGGFSDILSDLFGGGARRPPARARATRPSAAATSRPRCTSRSSRRWRARRCRWR